MIIVKHNHTNDDNTNTYGSNTTTKNKHSHNRDTTTTTTTTTTMTTQFQMRANIPHATLAQQRGTPTCSQPAVGGAQNKHKQTYYDNTN